MTAGALPNGISRRRKVILALVLASAAIALTVSVVFLLTRPAESTTATRDDLPPYELEAFDVAVASWDWVDPKLNRPRVLAEAACATARGYTPIPDRKRFAQAFENARHDVDRRDGRQPTPGLYEACLAGMASEDHNPRIPPAPTGTG